LWSVESNAPLIGEESGSPVFTEEFLSPSHPLTFVVCVKLNPSAAHRSPLETEAEAVNYFSRLAHAEGLTCLAGGGLGWQDVVLVLRGSSYTAVRSFMGAAFSQPWDHGLGRPMIARSITYSGVFFDTYRSTSHELIPAHECNARILLSLQPGVSSPLPSLLPVEAKVAERFGEYDLTISFESHVHILEVANLVRVLRASNVSGDSPGWLLTTSTELDFPLAAAVSYGKQPPPVVELAAVSGLVTLVNLIGKVKWQGVSPIQSERLGSILLRVASLASDPSLRDFIGPVARYLSALGEDIKAATEQVPVHDARWGSAVFAVEPFDLDQICTVLELAVRQRTESVMQFLFNALPGGFQGRGLSNRLLQAADGVLRDVARSFDVDLPGFVVFGVPNEDGFAAYGPLVVAPLPALFEPEKWWLLYHEAGNYLDQFVVRSQNAESDPRVGTVPTQEKWIPDLVTLALPFQGDLDLMCIEEARHLAWSRPPRARKALLYLAVRLLGLHLLTELIRDLEQRDREDELRLLSGVSERCRVALDQVRSAGTLNDELLSRLDRLLSTLWRLSPSFRRRQVPATTQLANAVREGLIRHLQGLRGILDYVQTRRRAGDLIPARTLARIFSIYLGGEAADHTTGPEGEVSLAGDSQPPVSHVVYRITKRAAQQPSSPLSVRYGAVQFSFRDRVKQYLRLWEAAWCSSASNAFGDGNSGLGRKG
jgi:hypothetical protein